MIEDLDMDGNPDLRGVMEFGAKWQRYCIWLFDPSSGRFENNFLAKQMELLTNRAETERRMVLPGDNRRAREICDALGGV